MSDGTLMTDVFVFGAFGLENFRVMSKFYIIPASYCVVFPLGIYRARRRLPV